MTEASGILNWLDDERLALPRANLLAVFDDRSQTLQSTPDAFVLMKSKDMIEWYETSFAPDRTRRVLEIGIFKGGSVVLFSELWNPERLVAVDIAADPVPALADYVRRCGLERSVRPIYGVDQSDSQTVRSIIAAEFEDHPLDLVVDDGCHFLEETRATFETVFPFVRPGGTYVIEDWGWAHWPGEWQKAGGPWPDKPAPTLLVLELAMLCASHSDLVESVEVSPGLIVVHKGPGDMPHAGFSLSSSYLTAGRVFLERGFASPIHASTRAVCARRVRGMARTIRSGRMWRAMAPLRRLLRSARR